MPEVLKRFKAAIDDAAPGDLDHVLRHLLAAEAFAGSPLGLQPQAPPSQRRPRRNDVVTYRVRVDLKGTKPPLWRRLELASDLDLAEVHNIIQAAFGWTDSHLHRFSSGPHSYSHDAEHYLCPFDAAEGETGIPEAEVRLDEVLADVGDKLFYTYDFGDDWEHTIRLEAVSRQDHSAPRAICTGGRRPGPAEDCGGVYGYELIASATDPTHPDHPDAVAEFGRFYGNDVGPRGFYVTPFDADEINSALAGSGTGAAIAETGLPAPLGELVGAIRTTAGRRQLRRLINDAALDEPVQVDAETADRMVHPYTWLLDRVGADGIALTGAGYLPPFHVAATLAELGLAENWLGKGNREIQTLPVLNLRESAQKMGLLRKHRGRLVLTHRGRAMRTDPVKLWWHLAERMPLSSTDACEAQAGLLLMVGVAARLTDDLYATVASLLSAIGWMGGDGTPVNGALAGRAAWDSNSVLWRLGAYAADRGPSRSEKLTTDGVTFARAALRTWPDGH